MNFPGKFIEWIKMCLTGSWFSVSMNGGLEGYFKGRKGVRQVDPLSPYIFVIVMNSLSNLLDLAVKHEVFRYHPKCKRVKLTHLSFADDLLVFTRGEEGQFKGLKMF